MQIMGSWCSKCYYSCCGESGEINLHPQLLDKQRVTTVRRISSVGITVVNDDGEESEIPRHSSILQSYNGLTVPLSVQPGVTREDVASRIKALPTIVETPPTKHKTKGWKKALTGSKGDFSLDRPSREKEKPRVDNDIRLTLFRKVNGNNEVSLSQDDVASKRSNPNDPAWRPLRRPSYSSSTNLFAMKASDKSSQHMLSLAEYSRLEHADSEEKRSSWLESHSLEALSADEESEASKLAKQYGLDLSLYVQHDISSAKSPVVQ
uniref:Altered inheritance of mitochondria protein 31, mitochondrial n=1 Tax=Lygus hesperus TaxID=30085 RepID=A0A0A9Y0E2_LYGHE